MPEADRESPEGRPPRAILHIGGDACGGGAARQVISRMAASRVPDGQRIAFWRLSVAHDLCASAIRLAPGEAAEGESESAGVRDVACLHELIASVLDETASDTVAVLSSDGWGVELARRTQDANCGPACSGSPIDAAILIRPQMQCLPTLFRQRRSPGQPFAAWFVDEGNQLLCDWNAQVEGAIRGGVRHVEVGFAGGIDSQISSMISRLLRCDRASPPLPSDSSGWASGVGVVDVIDGVRHIIGPLDPRDQRALLGYAREVAASLSSDLAARSDRLDVTLLADRIRDRYDAPNWALAARTARAGTELTRLRPRSQPS